MTKKYQALHACTTSMFAFWSVGTWERGYMSSLVPRPSLAPVFAVYKKKTGAGEQD